LIESLDIESPAKSKAGALNSTEKKNSVTQIRQYNNNQGDQLANWNIKQCPRENHQLYQEGEDKGKLFPGSDKSKRRDSRQQNEEDRTGESKPRGCYICFALGSSRWNNHSDTFCWSKERFAKIKNGPEAYFLEQIELMQQEPVDKRSEQTSDQSQNPRRSKTDRQGQANQVSHNQRLRKSSFCKVLQSILNCRNRCNKYILKCREYWDPNAFHHSMQSPSVGEFINPWQLQGMQQSMQGGVPGGPSLYHSRQFVQSPNLQMMHRQALMSEIQDSAGDSPQMNILLIEKDTRQCWR
jgi:hypothetical protein